MTKVMKRLNAIGRESPALAMTPDVLTCRSGEARKKLASRRCAALDSAPRRRARALAGADVTLSRTNVPRLLRIPECQEAAA